MLVEIGVNDQGYRKILGVCEGAKDDKTGWSSFLRHLKERGLQGVWLFITMLVWGWSSHWQTIFLRLNRNAALSNFYRNVFRVTPAKKMPGVVAMLKGGSTPLKQESSSGESRSGIRKAWDRWDDGTGY